jgi:peptidoglycan/LPS O-acetylase OafA/YrhL
VNAPEPVRAERPADLRELTSARGFAAAAVVLYHVDGYSGGVIGEAFPTGVTGRLAVDFFFVLSGFVLAHVYGAAWEAGRYDHRDFLVRRIARIWPLHLVCLFGVASIVGAGSLIGMAPPWTPTLASFAEHAALLNAVGLISENAWNQPSWSVGAEWTAYLCFPAYLAAVSALTSPAEKLAAAAILMAGLSIAVRAVWGAELFELTGAGAIRIIPSFFAGVALRQILSTGVGAATPPARLARMTVELLVVMALAAFMGAPALLLWFGLLGLVYLLALRGLANTGGWLRSSPLVWLGEISYALYLVHAPVLMVTFGLGAKLLGVSGAAGLIGLGLFGALAALAAAAILHHAVERPAQRFIVTRAGRSGASRAAAG